MRLDAEMTAADIGVMLQRAAHEAYGPERAQALAETLAQTASWLARIAQHRLDLDAAPPDISGLPNPEET